MTWAGGQAWRTGPRGEIQEWLLDRAVQGVSTFALLSTSEPFKKYQCQRFRLSLSWGGAWALGFKFPGDSALQSRALSLSLRVWLRVRKIRGGAPWGSPFPE